MFDTLLALDGALSVILTGFFTFHPFQGPFWRGCATGDPRNRANPILIPFGVGSGEGDARKERLCELSPLLTGGGNTSSEQGPSPKGTFAPLQGCPLAGRQQAAATQASQFPGNRFGFCYLFGSTPI